MDKFPLTDTPSPFHAEKLQAMGLLTGGVAHDFNNILAIIEGYACMLEHQFGSDPALQDKIAAILTATGRGVALTQSLLAFGYPRSAAAIASGCDLIATLESNRALWRALLGSRIELIWQLPPAPLWLDCADDDVILAMIHQCHQIRQTIPGTGRIQMTLVISDQSISVILQNAADGTRLQKSFPRRDHNYNTLQNKTVLIVDDEEALLPVLEYQLQNLGLKVLKAANADSALLLQKDYPDAIDFLLTDIVMPDVDGLQLAEIMADDRPRMGVVYMTGHAGMAVPESSLVLPKPLNPEMLSDALRKALEQVGEA